jgi:hypothetical protein
LKRGARNRAVGPGARIKGRIERAVSIEAGELDPEEPLVMCKVAKDDNLAVRLQDDSRDRSIRARSSKTGVEGAIGIKAGQVGAARARDRAELAAGQEGSARFDGERIEHGSGIAHHHRFKARVE